MRRIAIGAAFVVAVAVLALTLVPPPRHLRAQALSVGNWGIQHTPAASTQATITRAAGTGLMRHVATSATVCIVATAAQTALAFNLRDGATGAGTIIWSVSLAGTAGTGQCVPSGPIHLVGSTATAMTLESSAAPTATNFVTVTLTGYDTL